MKIELTPRQMHDAFIAAEQETAKHFNGQTCAMKTKDGNETCPICYFHIAYKKHLGIDANKYWAALEQRREDG